MTELSPVIAVLANEVYLFHHIYGVLEKLVWGVIPHHSFQINGLLRGILLVCVSMLIG